MERTGPGPGLALRLLGAWGDLRGSCRALIGARPGEGALLALALGSGLLWFLGRVAQLWLSPAAARMPEAELIGRVAAEFVGALIFRTLLLYGLAALVCVLARAVGGSGRWYETRAALFWAALVAAPVILAGALLQPLAAGAPQWVAVALASAGSAAFAVATAQCVAEAHGFRNGWAVLAVTALGLIALLAPLALIGRG